MAFLPPLPRKHKGTLATCMVALILFVIAAVYGDHGLIHLLRMQSEQRQLEHVAFDLQQQNEHLRERIRRLQSDDHYIEKLARERLGLVRKGEIMYRVTGPVGAPPARAK
jgi:cell division protein FtsB